jgi:hypothetical protein
MGRQAQERASRPRAPEGSHPPPRRPPYSADVTKRRYKAPFPVTQKASKDAPEGVEWRPLERPSRHRASRDPQDEVSEFA